MKFINDHPSDEAHAMQSVTGTMLSKTHTSTQQSLVSVILVVSGPPTR